MRHLRLPMLIAVLFFTCVSAGSIYDFLSGLLDGWTCGGGNRGAQCPD